MRSGICGSLQDILLFLLVCLNLFCLWLHAVLCVDIVHIIVNIIIIILLFSFCLCFLFYTFCLCMLFYVFVHQSFISSPLVELLAIVIGLLCRRAGRRCTPSAASRGKAVISPPRASRVQPHEVQHAQPSPVTDGSS